MSLPSLPTPGGDADTWGDELNTFLTALAASVAALEAATPGPYIDAVNTAGTTVLAGTTATFATVGGWTNSSNAAPYVASTGRWTPAAGRWRVSATLSFITPDARSDVQARLLAAGTRVLDYDNQAAVVGGRTWIHLTGTDSFSGSETLEIQVRQDTAPVALAAAAGYNHLDAEWVCP